MHIHIQLSSRFPAPTSPEWEPTGAEIKSCCRLASLLDVPLIQASQNVAPVAVTAGDKIEGLRQWASGRCLSADRAGVYSRSAVGEGMTAEQMLQDYPDLEAADIQAALEYAAEAVRERVLPLHNA